MSPVVDTDRADIVDTSHVDAALASVRQNEENARRRATVLTWGKAVLLGSLGVAAVIAAVAFLMQPKVIETTKVVEKPVIVEKQVVVEKPVIVHDGPVAKADPPPKPPEAPLAPKAPVPPPQPETHPWSKLDDKKYVGILTDVINGSVCFNHDTANCVHPVKMTADGHVATDDKGQPMRNPDIDWSPMTKWKGSSVYSAHRPGDPPHIDYYWVADNGTLIMFEPAPIKGKADAIMLKSDGQNLLLDVGLGSAPRLVRSFILDTGASSMTVPKAVADQLVSAGRATRGESIPVTLADGSHPTTPTILIDEVTVGVHTVDSVVAFVTPDSGLPLLGMNVLTRIGPFTVDALHLTLTFGGAA